MLELTPRETSASEILSRHGYQLQKQYQNVKGFREGFMIVDIKVNGVVLGSNHWPYDGTLREVEEFISAYC